MNISDKVVCISDRNIHDNEHYYHPNGYIRAGQVYCVRAINELCRDRGLMLVGHPCIWRHDGDDVGYLATRFRLLSDVKTENAARNQADMQNNNCFRKNSINP